MGEECDVTAGSQGAFDDCLGTCGDLFDRLSVEDAVLPDGPARPLSANLGRGAAIVASVVPFGEIIVDLRTRRRIRRCGRSLWRAGEGW